MTKIRVCNDNDCPKCGHPEIISIIDDEDMRLHGFECNKCGWSWDLNKTFATEITRLLMTKEECAKATWFELDDATIGKLIKATALNLIEYNDERKRVGWWSAALILCGITADAKAKKAKYDITGFSYAGKSLGDWRITIERIK